MAWVDSRYVCPGCGRGVYPLAQPTARNVLDVTRLWHWECERRQREEYPELASNRKWLDEYNLAVGRTHEYLRVLTGGELAQAQRELRAGTR